MTISFKKETLDQITPFYSGGNREYHNWAHIKEGLDLIAEYKEVTPNQGVAWLFHDAIYDANSKTNEVASARVARLWMQTIQSIPVTLNGKEEVITFTKGDIDDVYQMITDTKHHQPRTESSKLIIDLDNYRFTLPYNSFARHSWEVMEEFGNSRSEEVRRGRFMFLRSYIRSLKFHTDLFSEEEQRRAFDNINQHALELSYDLVK